MDGALWGKQWAGDGLAMRKAQAPLAAVAIYAALIPLALWLLVSRGPLPHALMALWLAMSLLGPAAAAIVSLREDGASTRGFGPRPVGEPAQMVIRLFMPGLILAYLLGLGVIGVPAARLLPLIALDIAATIYAWMLLAHFLLKPQPSPLRRWVAMLSDVGLLSISLHSGGALSVPWFSLYFWIVLGFGTTPRALAAAAAATLLGFAAVYAQTPYWQARPGLAAGIALALILLPAHLATLPRRVAAEGGAGADDNTVRRRALPRSSVQAVTAAPGRRVLDILFAENEDAPRSPRQMLEAAGHRVTAVSNGADAFSLLERRRFDLLLIEEALQGMSGSEIARLYRLEHLGDARLPIIAIAEAAGTEARCRDAGIDAVVARPFSAPALLAAIDETVRRLATSSARSIAAPRTKESVAVLDDGVIGALEALGGADFLDDVAATFRAEGRRLLDELRRSVRDADLAGFARLADSLYDAALNVGGLRLAQALAMLRGIGIQDLSAHGEGYIATLRREFARLEAALGAAAAPRSGT
jgi:CheY-like chemotaxis protein